MTYDVDVLGEDVKWFMQYSGYGETTALSLYTKTANNPTWRKYMRAKHVLDVRADGPRVLIMCKSAERKKDFKVAGFVDSFGYEEYNEELNTEGENVRMRNGAFLTYCIIYGETNEHANTQQERAVMIEEDYKAALERVKQIVLEAKEARIQASSKKKEIRAGKRKAGEGSRHETPRKRARRDDEEDDTIPDSPEADVGAKRGKKKPIVEAPFLELEKAPKKSKSGPPDKSVQDRLMDLELFKNKYKRVWIFGEGVSGDVSVFNIQRGDAGYNCRPISEAHLKEMKTWLFNYAFLPKTHPNFLTIVPADRREKPANFDEVKDKSFHVVNGQHTLAACLEYAKDPNSTEEVREFFSKWPCNVVWSPEGDDDPLFHLSGVLNLDSEYRKHFPSWVECIQHARKTWIRRGRPARTMREKAANTEAYKKWKVFLYFSCSIAFSSTLCARAMPLQPTGVRPWEDDLPTYQVSVLNLHWPFILQDFLTCLMWTFRVEKEANLIMEHVFPALSDDLWDKWKRIFINFENGEYIDVKTLGLMKDKKGFKPRSVVKNDLKHTRGLTEVELDMAADQCLVTREGEKHPRHTLKTIGDWAFHRKKKNETYIAMAECLNPVPAYLVLHEQKKSIDREKWKEWKQIHNFGRLQRERLLELLGGSYLAAALNPAKKKVPVPGRFKEGVHNILVATVTDVSEDHTLLSISRTYHCSVVDEYFGPITHALLDTRFLPGLQAGVDGPGRVKEVLVSTLDGLRRDLPGILKSPKMWTVISEFTDRQFTHNVLKTYLPVNIRFCEAFYHACSEENVASMDNFFEENVLRVTTCIFPNKDESSSQFAVRLCGGRKMLNMHDPKRYRRYSVKRAYLSESGRSIFKGELRMQTYIDIIKPSSLEGTVFLNVCGGNKAHTVAHVSISNTFPFAMLHFKLLHPHTDLA